MSSNPGVIVLLHYPLLQLQVIGDVQEVSVIEEPILKLLFHAADGVCLGVLECLDYDSDRVLPSLFLISHPNLP
jgi:hypothetical protein